MLRRIPCSGSRVLYPGSALSDLTDQRLAQVINWMLVNFSEEQLPEDFAPYTASEVGVLRADPLIEVQAVRAALVEKVDRVYRHEEAQ